MAGGSTGRVVFVLSSSLLLLPGGVYFHTLRPVDEAHLF